MSENSKKAARVNSLKKKLQVLRAATGGPKGDFYIIGGAVKDGYDGLFVMERYHGKSIVVCLGPRTFSSDECTTAYGAKAGTAHARVV